MSGAQTSTFAEPNILLRTLSGQQTADVLGQQIENQQNQLLMSYRVQGAAQQVGEADMAAVGQASQALLNNYPDEVSRAAAYPGIVADLQRLGFAKNAPSAYPGEQALKTIVARSLPVQTQYNLGLATDPTFNTQLQQILTGRGAPSATATASGSGGGSQALTGDLETDRQIIAKRESGGDPTALNYVAKADPTAYARGATASGKYQFVNSTWQEGMKLAGIDNPAQYPTAMSAPEAVQDKVFTAVYGKYGTAPWDPSTYKQAWVPTPGGRMILANTTAPASGSTVAITGPRGGVAARTGGTDVAGPGAGTGATAPPAGPATTDLMGPRPLPLFGAKTPVMTPAQIANTPVQVPTNQLTPPAQPSASQPPAAPAPAPAPVAQPPTAPPGPQANLPHAWEVPTGQQSAQFQQARQLEDQAAALTALAARYQPNSPQARQALAYAASLTQRATELKGLDTIVQSQEGPVHVLTGQQDKPIAPLADYHETSPGSGIWVGGPGTEPRFQPPGRLIVTPGGDVYQTTPGGPVLLKHTDPTAVQALEAAKSSGAAIGTATGKLTDQLAEQGRNSAQAIGNIDYGLNQIVQAKQGGIPTGYFAPWLATASAVGKSLGIDTSALGIDPAAVGNIQTAAKTLAVVSGAILQQVLGPDSQITDAKIQHFIHAQPGIETDPDALNRVLNWARSQFVYEREMASQGMKDAAANPSGVLPPNWKASYFAAHGFAPIYNPATGEMEQPEGRTPPRAAPSQPPTAPINPAARTAGTTYQTPKGPMKWTGTGWLPAGQ